MKLLKSRRIIVVIGALAALLAVGYTQVVARSGAPKPVPDPGPGQHGPMLALDSRVINLQPGGAYTYAKISVTLELRPDSASFYTLTGDARATAESTADAQYTDATPLLLDALGQVVAGHNSNDLVTSAGREALKGQVLTAMRQVLGQRTVLAVYFTDFVMQ